MNKLWQVAPTVIAIDEHRNEKCPDASHRAGFYGGEHAKQDAADNDDDRNQAPTCFDGDPDSVAQGNRVSSRVAVAVGDEDTQRYQRHAEHQTRYHTGHEKADNRDRPAGRKRINNRIMTGRYHDGLD